MKMSLKDFKELFFLVLLLEFTWGADTKCESWDTSMATPFKFRDLVPDHYDKLIPPMEDNAPVVVKIKIAILNIQFVDEVKQAYAADIFFHQYWRDCRIRIPQSYNASRMVLDGTWRPNMWTPGTYFKNILDGKVNDVIIPYSYTVVNNHSDVFFATRVSLKLSCEMDLTAYPHDVQECEIAVMSLQHTNDTVVLEWKGFQITENILLAQYYVSGDSKEDCTRRYKIGAFSCLRGKIKLSRRLGFFLINKYIPCVLIVLMSFVTFWIPAEAYPARVTLSVTSLLTIVTQQYQSSMPSVSYVIALNIWMLSCIGFVFFSLLEYAFIITLMNQREATSLSFHKFKKWFTSCKAPSATDGDYATERTSRNHTKSPGIDSPRKNTTYQNIDRISRIIFPVFFFLFVVSYLLVFCF